MVDVDDMWDDEEDNYNVRAMGDWDIVSALRRRAVMQTATGISKLTDQIEWMAADEIETMRQAMHDIYEVYAGSEGFIPQTCPEAYLQERVKEMADIAAKHKRAALAARLAPVEDEALVEIVAEAINDSSKNIARAAIAAIRPHIEAAERERCAKIAEGFLSNRDWVPGSLWGNIRNEIAAAIRSGK